MSHRNERFRVLLHGIGGTYNYGCEAIVRGAVRLFAAVDPRIDVYYASPDVPDDRRRLQGCSVAFRRRNIYGRFSPKALGWRALRYAGNEVRPAMEDMDVIDGMDAVVSIGGDLFVCPGGALPDRLMAFGEAVIARGKPYVLLGASLGPPPANEQNHKLLAEHLSHFTLINPRERRTVEYLASIGLGDKVIPSPDPAFLLAAEPLLERRLGVLTIGVNLSPLAADLQPGGIAQVLGKQAEVVRVLATRLDANVVLVPHTFCARRPQDDDHGYLKRIWELLPPSISGRVRLIEADTGYLGIRNEIQRCDVVLAARMHCGINAVSCRVPAIFLSYSPKAVGMCSFVYGTSEWAVPLGEMPSQGFLQLVEEALRQRSCTSSRLQSRLAAVPGEFGQLITVLRNLFERTPA